MTEKEIAKSLVSGSIQFAKEIAQYLYDEDTFDWLKETQTDECIMYNVLLDVRDNFLQRYVRKI